MPIGSRTPGVPNGPSNGPRLVGSRSTGLAFVPMQYESLPFNATAGADGVARINVGPAPMDRVWRVERISVFSSSAAATTASVYLDAADPANLVDTTPNGNGDIADEVSPILVSSGQLLVIVWTGADSGAICSARVQFVAGHLEQLPLSSFGG